MSRSAEQCKALGNTCMKDLDFAGAIVNYRSGLKLEPKNPILNCNLAQAYLNLKDYGEAEKFAKLAIEHQGNYVKAYYRAAKAALGRHIVYESMMYLAQGVKKCGSQDLEELFLMARELSLEFESSLRNLKVKEKPEETDSAGCTMAKSGKQGQKTKGIVKSAPENAKSGNETEKSQTGKTTDKIKGSKVTEKAGSSKETEKAKVNKGTEIAERSEEIAKGNMGTEKVESRGETEKVKCQKEAEKANGTKDTEKLISENVDTVDKQMLGTLQNGIKDPDLESVKQELELHVKETQRKLEEKQQMQKQLELEQELLKRENEELERDNSKLKKEMKALEEFMKQKAKGNEKQAQDKDQGFMEQEQKDCEKKDREKVDREVKDKELMKKQELDKMKRKEETLKVTQNKDEELKLKSEQAEELRLKMKKDEELKHKAKKDKELKLKIKKESKLQLKKDEELKLQLKNEEELKLKLKENEEINLNLKKEEERMEHLQKELHGMMKDGSVALIKGLNRKAVDNLKKVLDIINSQPPPAKLGFSDQMDIVVLQFAFSQALILSDEYKDIVRAIEVLENMEKEGKHSKFPAIFLLLGRAYVRLNRFKNAQLPLERGLSFLSRGTSFSRYSWPGTSDVIEYTDRKILKDSLQLELQICQLHHKPDAVCFYGNCLDTSQHLIPSRDIWFSDPDFVGFVDILCQEHCHIYFHMLCWKDYKERLSEVEKLCEKDFLGQKCLTPDCRNSLGETAVITKVTIIGPDGEEKSTCSTLFSILTQNKEKVSIVKSPKKKQRKKEVDKTDRGNIKRTRKDSKCRADSPSDLAPQRNNQGCQFKDALSKLAMARDSNFGYDTKAPDAYKGISKPLKTSLFGQNEEFVYSYFHEIFKEEGFMSIFKLQEHWETNKELLPVLEPALITHTDLVKFLLDTESFAVVQDMIGIASELANIAAIVESKSEGPLPTEYKWQPSQATVLEASRTLSFTSASNYGETDCEETDSKMGNVTQYVYGVTDYGGVCEDSGSSTSSYHSTNEVDLKIEDIKAHVESEPEVVPNSYNHDFYNHQSDAKPSHISTYSPKKSIPYRFSKTDVECHLSQKLQLLDVTEEKICIPVLKTSEFTEKSVEAVPFVPKSIKIGVPLEKETPHLEAVQDIQTGLNGYSQHLPLTQATQPAVQKPGRAAWKPRAKLLEWACETFPGISKVKLWEALTEVRTQNNCTLSGLSFDVLEERVRCVLLLENTDF